MIVTLAWGCTGLNPWSMEDYLTLSDTIVEVAKLLAEDIVRWRLGQHADECEMQLLLEGDN